VVVSLLRYLVNKSILVSIPVIFGSRELRRCLLVSVDVAGLWLQSEAFAEFAGDNAALSSAPVFIPFAQITCLVGPPRRPQPRAPDHVEYDHASTAQMVSDKASTGRSKSKRNERNAPQKKPGGGRSTS
jgi:hypothetical protein